MDIWGKSIAFLSTRQVKRLEWKCRECLCEEKPWFISNLASGVGECLPGKVRISRMGGARAFSNPWCLGVWNLVSDSSHLPSWPPERTATAMPALIFFLHLKTLPAPAPRLKKGWTPCAVTGRCFQGGHDRPTGPHRSIPCPNFYWMPAAEHLALSVAACELLHSFCISYSSLLPKAEISFLETSPGPQEPCLHSRGLRLESES